MQVFASHLVMSDGYPEGFQISGKNHEHIPLEDTIHKIFRPPKYKRKPKKELNLGIGKGRKTKIRSCAICGDKAHSLHFGGLSCDSCKAFFRRSVQSGAFRGFTCSRLDGCTLTISTRRSCQKCRFNKCVSVGMEPDWVLSEQKRHSMQFKHLGSKKKKQLSELDYSTLSKYLSTEERIKMNNIYAALHFARNNSSVDSNENIFMPEPYVVNSEGLYALYKKISVNLTTVLKFCRTVLQSISPHTNLSESLFLEVCLLHVASTFGKDLLKQKPTNRERWVTPCYKEHSVKCESSVKNGIGMAQGTVEQRRYQSEEDQFIGSIWNLKLDDASLSLVTIITMLDPYHEANEADSAAVEKLQEFYSLLLQRYMAWKYGPQRAVCIFAQIIIQLTALKQIAFHKHSCLGNLSFVSMLKLIISKCWTIGNAQEEDQTLNNGGAPFQNEFCLQSKYSHVNKPVPSSCLYEKCTEKNPHCIQWTYTPPPETRNHDFLSAIFEDYSCKIPYIEPENTLPVESNSENVYLDNESFQNASCMKSQAHNNYFRVASDCDQLVPYSEVDALQPEIISESVDDTLHQYLSSCPQFKNCYENGLSGNNDYLTRQHNGIQQEQAEAFLDNSCRYYSCGSECQDHEFENATSLYSDSLQSCDNMFLYAPELGTHEREFSDCPLLDMASL